MAVKTGKFIMSATSPYEIFSMNPDTIDQQFEEYREAYKPQAYNNIQNFVIMQKVTTLYREAKEILEGSEAMSPYYESGTLEVHDRQGVTYTYRYRYKSEQKVATMFVTAEHVVFLIPPEHKDYCLNFCKKVEDVRKKKYFSTWKDVEPMIPFIVESYITKEGPYIITLKKPCERIYPMRELLNYFGGALKPEYVSAIIHRLYHFVAHMGLLGMTHNAITVDNLFFAPGRRTEDGEAYKIDDLRFVGVFGGWFFTTSSDEKIAGMPREIFELAPDVVKRTRYSNFEVDELAIKRVGRELLGDVTGSDLGNTPEPMARWLNDPHCKEDAYAEYEGWENTNILAFGKRRFVDMDVSI
jgi:hypothetical protein